MWMVKLPRTGCVTSKCHVYKLGRRIVTDEVRGRNMNVYGKQADDRGATGNDYNEAV